MEGATEKLWGLVIGEKFEICFLRILIDSSLSRDFSLVAVF